MGRDYFSSFGKNMETWISIHAPRMGRDLFPTAGRAAMSTFQSTRPAWGATNSYLPSALSLNDFNPRAPHGARLLSWWSARASRNFNPRAPHGARRPLCSAPRRCSTDFNPRAPHGARHDSVITAKIKNKFQSTRPAWGATAKLYKIFDLCCTISTKNNICSFLRTILQ